MSATLVLTDTLKLCRSIHDQHGRCELDRGHGGLHGCDPSEDPEAGMSYPRQWATWNDGDPGTRTWSKDSDYRPRHQGTA